MTSTSEPRRPGLALAAILATALLTWFGTGLDPLWPLMWLAPLPVLLFAGRAGTWGAALTAALGWLLGNLNLWHYLHSALGLPPFLLLRIFSAQAVVFALAVLLYRALLSRGAHGMAVAAFPALWVSFEYLLNLTSPHATAGNLAYTQLGFLPFLQLASLTGPWGISFLLLAFASALATAFHLRATAPRRALRIAAAWLAAIAMVLLFGAWRLARPAPGPPVTVGLVASDAPASPEVADEGEPTARLLHAYAERVSALASRGARVIVLPEKLGVVVDPATRDTDAFLQSLADHTRTTLVVGLIHVAPPVQYNQARIYSPQAPPGQEQGRDQPPPRQPEPAVLSYDKQHMLPPFESKFKPGTALTLLTEPSGTWGVAICKDMDFTPLSRDYGRAGAGLLLVPAWDFNEDRSYHGHMAVMRGVESGFSIVRAAKNGYLTVADDRGRILAETRSDAAPFATLLATVPSGHDATLYLRLGDWFAWLVLALFALALLRSVLPPAGRRESPR